MVDKGKDLAQGGQTEWGEQNERDRTKGNS